MVGILEIVKKPESQCPECRCVDIVTDRSVGEIVCSKCGLVIQDQILSLEPEWRAYTFNERAARMRIGLPTSLIKFDMGFATSFQPNKDAHGKALPPKDRLKMQRLHKWNSRARLYTSKDRNLTQAMLELTRLVNKLRIPKAVEENAALIYRKTLKKNLIRGRSIHGIIAGALHAACRLTQTPRSLNEIVNASTRSRKEISRYSRLILRELNIPLPVDEPETYVPKIASKVGLDQKTQNIALKLLQSAKKIKAVVGKAPAGIAASALYIASKLNRQKTTQKELAKAADVTEVTIRNRYKKLVSDLWSKSDSLRYLTRL